jgi:hypothetical protein
MNEARLALVRFVASRELLEHFPSHGECRMRGSPAVWQSNIAHMEAPPGINVIVLSARQWPTTPRTAARVETLYYDTQAANNQTSSGSADA